MTHETLWRRTIREDTENEGAWDSLKTPKDWREPTFQPRRVIQEYDTLPGDGTIPLWVTLIMSLGLWLVIGVMVAMLWSVL